MVSKQAIAETLYQVSKKYTEHVRTRQMCQDLVDAAFAGKPVPGDVANLVAVARGTEI